MHRAQRVAEQQALAAERRARRAANRAAAEAAAQAAAERREAEAARRAAERFNARRPSRVEQHRETVERFYRHRGDRWRYNGGEGA